MSKTFNATDECIEPMKLLLADKEDYVRAHAMIGIKRAVQGERGTSRFMSAIFEAVVPLLDQPDDSLSRHRTSP